MTEEKKKQINEKFKEYRDYTDDIAQSAKKISSGITKELDECIEEIMIKTKEGKLLNMTFGELEILALKIPALCYYIQTKLNNYALVSEIEELIIDERVMKRLDELKGEKGDAREKMKRAEAYFTDDRIVEILNKQIYSNLKESITRADKVYEGIKKILDARTRENEYNRKAQMYAT